jgi:hypothetical protein
MAGHFTGKLWITPVDANGKKWETGNPFAWHFGYEGSVLHALIPEGFIYDLASVPWIAQPLVPHTVAPQASALHDFGYRFNQVLVVKEMLPDGTYSYHGESVELGKKDWDYAFYQGMLSKGVSETRARWAYKGVKYGGGRTWRRHRERDKHWSYDIV